MKKDSRTDICVYWGKQVGMEDERDNFLFESNAGMGRIYTLTRITDDPINKKAKYLGTISFDNKNSKPYIWFEDLFVEKLERFMKKKKMPNANINDIVSNLEKIVEYCKSNMNGKKCHTKTLSHVTDFIKKNSLIKL